jgi:hypothetical protein
MFLLPSNFKPLERDDLQLSVVGSATPSQVVLAAIRLSSGMSVVLNSNISYEPRQRATVSELITALTSRIETLELNQNPIGSLLTWLGDSNTLPSN